MNIVFFKPFVYANSLVKTLLIYAILHHYFAFPTSFNMHSTVELYDAAVPV